MIDIQQRAIKERCKHIFLYSAWKECQEVGIVRIFPGTALDVVQKVIAQRRSG